MLSYHPALDATHSAFRAVRILLRAPKDEIERDRLRICDFYLLFPQLLVQMRLPRDQVHWRRVFRARESRYWFEGDPLMIFLQLAPLQEIGLALLESLGALTEFDSGGHRVRFRFSALPSALIERARERNRSDEKLLTFLDEVLLTMPLGGPGGLKDRSGLLEYRYDAT